MDWNACNVSLLLERQRTMRRVLTTYSCFQSTAHSCSVAVTSVTTESSSGTTVSYCLDKRENISKGTVICKTLKLHLFLISQHKGKYFKSNILSAVTLKQLQYYINSSSIIFNKNVLMWRNFLVTCSIFELFQLRSMKTLFMITACYVILPVNRVLQFVLPPSKLVQSIFHLQFICCPI